MGVLPPHTRIGDFSFSKAAHRVAPIALDSVKKLLCTVEQVGPPKGATCGAEREQDERLVVKISAWVKWSGIHVKPMDIETIGATCVRNQCINRLRYKFTPWASPTEAARQFREAGAETSASIGNDCSMFMAPSKHSLL